MRTDLRRVFFRRDRSVMIIYYQRFLDDDKSWYDVNIVSFLQYCRSFYFFPDYSDQ